MAAKVHEPGSDIKDLYLGNAAKHDVLVWDNTEGMTDCDVSGCQPALEKAKYHIPKGEVVIAKLAHKSDQTYKSTCNPHHTDPKLIVQ